MNSIIDFIKGAFLATIRDWKTHQYVSASIETFLILVFLIIIVIVIIGIAIFIYNYRDKLGQPVLTITTNVINRHKDVEEEAYVVGMIFEGDKKEYYITFEIDDILFEEEVDKDVYYSNTIEVEYIIGKSGDIHIEKIVPV
jgi:hypothetical protein